MDENFVKVDTIDKHGFGKIPKMLMKDERLTIEAKAIYAYLASYAGAGDTAFPSISLMCKDLGISEPRFYKHRKHLLECGYLSIEQVRDGTNFGRNIYTLNQAINPESPYPSFVSTQNVSAQNVSTQNEGTNKNSIKKNSIKKNSTNSTPASDESEEQLQALIDELEASKFRGIPSIVMKVQKWEAEGFDISAIHEAYRIAIRNNIYRQGYVDGIIKQWREKGIFTLADVPKDKPKQTDDNYLDEL